MVWITIIISIAVMAETTIICDCIKDIKKVKKVK